MPTSVSLLRKFQDRWMRCGPGSWSEEDIEFFKPFEFNWDAIYADLGKREVVETYIQGDDDEDESDTQAWLTITLLDGL